MPEWEQRLRRSRTRDAISKSHPHRRFARRENHPGFPSYFQGAVAAWTWQPAAFISSSACSPVASLTAAQRLTRTRTWNCLLYTSDAADDLLCVDLGGRRIIKKK